MKNLICLLLVAFLATTTFAQRKGMTTKSDAAVERMTKELDLSPDQQVKIKAIYQTKIEDKQSHTLQTKEEYAIARTDFDQKIAAVLTPTQIEKRKNLKAEQKEKMKELRQTKATEEGIHTRGQRASNRSNYGKKKRGKGQSLAKMSPEMLENRAVKSTEKLNKQVNLTEVQEATVKTAYLNFFQKNQAIASDTSLDAAAKKSMLAELKTDHKAEIKALLSEEQLAAKKSNKKVKKSNRKEKALHR